MDRSYMLNSYVKENEENLAAKTDAGQYLENLQFRIRGSKSIAEIKKEISIFLEKNNVPPHISTELSRICSGFNESTDLYQAEKYLEDFLSKYANEKENQYNQSNETVYEIKEELVSQAVSDLDKVGIKLTGDQEGLIDKIQTEDDVYKLKNNISTATEYFENRNAFISQDEVPTLEIPVNAIEEALDKPDSNTVLETALEEQERITNNGAISDTDIKDDGSVVVQTDANNPDSLNAAFMMVAALVAADKQFGLATALDMKIIKSKEDEKSLKMIYGNFPLTNRGMDPLIASKIQEISKNYNPNVNYMEVLSNVSPELAISLNIVHDHILNKEGAFQMAVKNGGVNHDIAFAMDENYADVVTAFHESGAMVSQDSSENSIIRATNFTQGEQLLILSSTFDNLNQKNLQMQTQNQLQNQYQKQLIPPTQMNQAANVHNTFLTVIAIAEIILLTFFFYFIFK